MYRNARLVGLLFLMAGIGLSVNLISAYHTRSEFFSKDLSLAPAMLLYGLSVVLQPKLLSEWSPDTSGPLAIFYRVTSIAIIVISFAIGLYLSLVVFKDWTTVPLRE
jgi:hypothetical protein